MEKFSHRDVYHRHLANIYNEKEKRTLSDKTKCFDKCREDKYYAHSCEAKELRSQLSHMLKEQQRLQREGSCLNKDALDADLAGISGPSQLDPDQTLLHDYHHDQDNQQITSHNVAVRMLNGTPRNKKKTSSEPGDGLEQKSWHGSTQSSPRNRGKVVPLPDIKQTNAVSVNANEGPHISEKHAPAERRAKAAKIGNVHGSKIQLKKSQSNFPEILRTMLANVPNENFRMGNSSVVPNVKSLNDAVISSKKNAATKDAGGVGATSWHAPNMAASNRRRHSETIHTHHDKKQMDEVSLQHYYDLLAQNERLLKEEDLNFEIPDDAGYPTSTMRRSQRRKLLAIEALLRQLPNCHQTDAELAQDALQCGYLRLSRENIEELEERLRQDGRSPGPHAHSTEDDVIKYYDELDRRNRLQHK